MSSSVLVVIAALNEEEGIGPCLRELREFMKESKLLIVDGNSTDKTVNVAKELGADVLFQSGSGKGDALAQAIKQVDSDSTTYVVFTDADYTYPAKYIPRMIQILEKNPRVGMVIGNRFNQTLGLTAMKSSFYMGNRILAYAHLFMNGINLNDPLTGLRAVKWSIIKNWVPKSKGFDIEVEMNNYIENIGYKTLEVPIEYRNRLGNKKLKIRDGIRILKRIVIESFK